MPLVIDQGHEESLGGSVCIRCRHWRLLEGRTCDAFPDGIPPEIWIGENEHRNPYPGDHGIRFEAVADPVTAGTKS